MTQSHCVDGPDKRKICTQPLPNPHLIFVSCSFSNFCAVSSLSTISISFSSVNLDRFSLRASLSATTDSTWDLRRQIYKINNAMRLYNEQDGRPRKGEINYINNLYVNVWNKKEETKCECFYYFRHNNERKTSRPQH